MFNPISVILREEEIYYIEEASSVKEIYHSNIEKISNTVIDAHDEFMRFQRKLMLKIKGKEPSIELTTSQLLSKKINIYSTGVFDMMRGQVTDNAKSLLKYIKNTNDQIVIIRKVFHKTPLLKRNLYSSRGIGFKTIELPTQEDYQKALIPYKQAWKQLEKLEEDELYKKFDKCYRSRENLIEEMFDKIEYYFKDNTNYYAAKYVDIYEDMNRDMINMLSNHKKRYKEIKDLLSEIHRKCTEEYNEDIQSLEKSIQNEKEKEKRRSIAIYNYKVLSDSILFMIEMVSIFHRIQLKILLMSYENYREVIQRIYDDIMLAR